jgi:hypothetical protein
MTGGRKIRISVDRRTTIKWLAATMAAASTGVHSNAKFLGDEIPPPPASTDPLLGVAGTPDDVGYGTDPDLIHPMVPWSRTMTAGQLVTSAALCDLILPADERSPAASEVGVPDFIDEWVSAPYTVQRHDRELILFGLEWLEQQSRDRFGASLAAAEKAQAAGLIEGIVHPDRAAAQPVDLGEFFHRFRFLAVGAYYTTEAGIKDIGYIGNVPISGDYPGPSRAAMTHLAGVLEKLGLSLPG